MKALSLFESTELEALCDLIQKDVVEDAGLKKYNGTYAKASVVKVDDDAVCVELKWGQRWGTMDDFENRDDFSIKRKVLEDKGLSWLTKFETMERIYHGRD